ncbi:MAG: Uma2 family endonuclease [Gemmatimonadaceae bacterium]
MHAPLYSTAEMVRELTDETRHWPRYETVYGELLVTPAPRWLHQEIVGRIYVALSEYLKRNPVGHLVMSPADVSWGPDTLVQPDVFVVPVEQARNFNWRDISTLLLAVEVLSPCSLRADRFTKRRLYQEKGVPLYWVIDADDRSAEVWTPSDRFPRAETKELTWSPADSSTPFLLSLADLFGQI